MPLVTVIVLVVSTTFIPFPENVPLILVEERELTFIEPDVKTYMAPNDEVSPALGSYPKKANFDASSTMYG